MTEMSRTVVSVIDRVPWWVRFGICMALVYIYATFTIWKLREWPWIAAAFTLPLPATLGALYAEKGSK